MLSCQAMRQYGAHRVKPSRGLACQDTGPRQLIDGYPGWKRVGLPIAAGEGE